MTTITYRDGVLAVDSQVTAHRIRVGSTTKAGRLPKGYRWAFAGSSQLMFAFAKWCERSIENDDLSTWDENPPRWSREDDATGILVFPDGKVSEYEGQGWLRVEAPFLAWGSGEQIALGAMAAGKTASEALEIACEYDVFTGGPVLVLAPEPERSAA